MLAIIILLRIKLRTVVDRRRADQFVVLALLDHVRNPARGTRHDEDRREETSRYTTLIVSGGTVKI
jgi:hypothetical protein